MEGHDENCILESLLWAADKEVDLSVHPGVGLQTGRSRDCQNNPVT